MEILPCFQGTKRSFTSLHPQIISSGLASPHTTKGERGAGGGGGSFAPRKREGSGSGMAGSQGVAENNVPKKMWYALEVILAEETPWRYAVSLPVSTNGHRESTVIHTPFSVIAAAFLQRCTKIVKTTGSKYATPEVGDIWEVVRNVGVSYKEYPDIDTTGCASLLAPQKVTIQSQGSGAGGFHCQQ